MPLMSHHKNKFKQEQGKNPNVIKEIKKVNATAFLLGGRQLQKLYIYVYLGITLKLAELLVSIAESRSRMDDNLAQSFRRDSVLRDCKRFDTVIASDKDKQYLQRFLKFIN